MSRPELRFLVMESLEGETLAERLRRGALPLPQALDCATQIADGLAAAHKHGVIHRDLKPGNVMLAKAGAKLLDFGLAKLRGHGDRPVAATLVSVPTQSEPLTGQGTILGTLQYMAPEQIEGKDADARTDLFAFGTIVYEMVTGHRAFEGNSAASLIGAILEREPAPLAERQPLTPPGLERLVRKCLAKSPDDRWYSAHDVADELRWISQTGAQFAVATSSPRRSRWRTVGFVTALLCFAALAAVVSWRMRGSGAPSATARITLALSADNSLILDGGVAISPDGQTLAFVARSPEGSRLYVRRLGEWESRAIPGTERAANPFFSPDGEWVAFNKEGVGLEKVPLKGGPPQLICKLTGRDVYRGSWRRDGSIVFGAWPNVGLWRVSAGGGTPEMVTRPEEGSGVRYMWPERLPDGRAVLFTVLREGRASIAALALEAGELRTIVESGSRPRYLPTGHLLYVSDGHLFAVPFDAQRLETRGSAAVVIDDVSQTPLTANYDVSANGALVYLPSQSSLDRLVWKDRRGATTPLAMNPRRYASPALSPDGRRVAVTVQEGPARNVWVGSVEREPLTRLTFGNDDVFSLWTPDGRYLAYTAGENGRYNMFRTSMNAGGTAEPLIPSSHPQKATSWSPGGDVLLFNDIDDIDPSTRLDIWTLLVDRKKAHSFVKTPFRELEAVFSPDGHWVAYQSNESGRFEVYVRAYPGPGAKTQISVDGGAAPSWNQNGRELFYQTATAMMAVPVLDARTLRVGVPVRLFDYSKTAEQGRAYEVNPDGQRFLMIEKADAGRVPSRLNLILNWFEELQARTPIGR